MTQSIDLIRVLYEPIRWADSGWLASYGVDGRWPARLSNRLLLRRASLANVTWDECQCAHARWLVAHWDDLPALAYIAGARIARDGLCSRNVLTTLRLNAAQFAAVPVFIPASAKTESDVSVSGDRDDMHEVIMTSGMRCIHVAMRGLAPGWQDRIRLRLPPHAETHALTRGPDDVHQPSTHDQRALLHLLKFAASFYRAQKY